MSHDLSLAQSHAFQLSLDLMVPVTVFEVDGEYGVLPSDEIDADDDLGSSMSSSLGRLIEPPLPFRRAACERQPAREASPLPTGTLHDPTIVSRALAAFALRGGWKCAREATGKDGKEENDEQKRY